METENNCECNKLIRLLRFAGKICDDNGIHKRLPAVSAISCCQVTSWTIMDKHIFSAWSSCVIHYLKAQCHKTFCDGCDDSTPVYLQQSILINSHFRPHLSFTKEHIYCLCCTQFSLEEWNQFLPMLTRGWFLQQDDWKPQNHFW